jgi:aerobic-type carbon monoxide dehydrogenase small subunit (CoxS/CutS family)
MNFYGEHMAKTKFIVDGKRVSIDGDPQMPLLYALRDDLKMKNPKFGCGLAQCGACTVHLNGDPVRSCVLPVSAVQNKQVTTISGLGTPDKPHPVQTAFIEEQAMQCGCSACHQPHPGTTLPAAVCTHPCPPSCEPKETLG